MNQPWSLRSVPLLVQGEKPGNDLVLRQVGGPAVSGGDGFIKGGVGALEPPGREL